MKKLPKIDLSVLKKLLPASPHVRKVFVRVSSIVLVVILAGGAFLIFRPTPPEKKNQQINQKLQALDNNKNTSCKDIVDQVGNTPVEDANTYEAQTALLEKQAQCYADQLQLDRAIAASEKLKALYDGKQDAGKAKLVQTRIDNYKGLKANMEESAKTPDENAQQ